MSHSWSHSNNGGGAASLDVANCTARNCALDFVGDMPHGTGRIMHVDDDGSSATLYDGDAENHAVCTAATFEENAVAATTVDENDAAGGNGVPRDTGDGAPLPVRGPGVDVVTALEDVDVLCEAYAEPDAVHVSVAGVRVTLSVS